MQGSLFTQEFLERGIRETGAWETLDDDAVAAFTDAITRIFQSFPVDTQANEAATESELIYPVLEALGWADYLPQQSTSARGRVDVPDALLFPDNKTKMAAQAERRDDHRYRHGIAVLESKRWQRALDRAGHGEDIDKTTPSTQILRYLSRAEVASERAIRWGILTNGRHWRLYWQGARSRSEQFLELDLAALAGVGETQGELFLPEAKNPEHFLRVFLLLFGRGAFLPQADDLANRSFHLIALEEGRHWEALVSEELGGVVFSKIFPGLIRALVDHDPQRPDPLNADYLEAVRADALLLLYRLLFCLYAEDRNLLPARDTRYDDYALRAIREDIATRRDANDVFSGTATRYWDHLANLFHMIDVGDTSIGLPPYNGGLFTGHRQHVINRARVPDSKLAPLIDILSRWKRGDKLHWINYRDLSVQQLGAIYERLLEYAAVPDEADGFVIRPNIFARRVSGSYYTHDALVRLIIKRSVGPLIDERRAAFSETAKALASKRKSKTDRLRELSRHDAAAEILKLKICDPAMGSGHFLVSLVDYLADEILQAMADAEAEVTWADENAPYQSPVARRIERIRVNILESAAEHDWNLREEQLDDRQIVRRLILKRVIFGVDKNPMAVELAKLALWLHTFTVGAPLSFLDHHLRCGDSLFGERLQPMLAELRKFGALFQMRELTRIGAAAKGMNDLAELTDTDIAEVRQSQVLFDEIERELKPLHAVLALWHAFRWLEPERGAETTKAAYADLLSGNYGDLFALAQGTDITAAEEKDRQRAQAVADLLATARELIAEQHFFAWELAFPTVWRDLAEGVPTGGFDVIIGNPPWDRIKLQQVEWFAERAPEIARAARAADRKRMIERLRKNDDPLYLQYEIAGHRAEAGARVARKSGYYPLLSKGDTNLYSLFVERAAALIKATGIVGLLTPSGIASDKGAAAFFQSIATTGRLAALLDFENKKVFFPDVHASFKFCCLVFGGEERRFEQTECAFFLHRVEELDEPERAFELSAADFDAVNPNTGTAPIFRSRRDADITAGIYQRLPVLVDRRTQPPTKLWPVRYTTMFHMTNDSHLFKRRDELKAEGFYPVAGNRWKKAETEYVPLHVGRMIKGYDHRAASVSLNEANLHNPALSDASSMEQKADTQFVSIPQYWVPVDTDSLEGRDNWAVAFRDIARATDARTVIATIIPTRAAGNKLPLLIPDDGQQSNYSHWAPLLLANINTFILDYVARQKVQSTNLNWYIFEQFPLVPPARFEDTISNQTIGDFVRGEVLRLTYTAEDMRPFAADMGHDGDPFVWDDEDRRHRMARLDALFFTLYGLNRDDAAYVLDQFPIIRQADEKTFGHFRTKEMILTYINAVAAGDFKTVVQV